MFANKIIRNVFIIALACVTGVACMSALAGCSGQSDEDLIKAKITKELDEVKNIDNESIKEVFGDEDLSSFDQIGLSATEFLKALLDGFDYEVNSVTVDEDKADAQVTFTSRKLESLNSFDDKVTDLVEHAVKEGNTNYEAIMKEFGPLLLKELEALEPSQTDVTLSFEKKDGEWTTTDASTEAFQKALIGDMGSLFK